MCLGEKEERELRLRGVPMYCGRKGKEVGSARGGRRWGMGLAYWGLGLIDLEMWDVGFGMYSFWVFLYRGYCT